MITSNQHGRPPRPRATPLPTKAQRAAVRLWATANVAGAELHELRAAEALLAQHPDADSSGYSQARQALARIRAELQRRG